MIEPLETTRNGTFSTAVSPARKRATLLMRQQTALAQTFQRGIESLKPIDASGALITAEGYDIAMDEAYPDLTQVKLVNSRGGFMPIIQLEWYAAQGFIGWQMCAMLSQNWLIDKCCGVPAQDAVRKGYQVTLNDGSKMDPKILNAVRLADKRININGKLKSFIKKGRIFGIRHALFLIDGVDYEAPFNPDGITPGSYRGIVQIDPYWLAPVLDRSAAANPGSKDFYEPTWWQLNGKRIHRSHFIIMRNSDEVVDLLKPAYYYGGIPIPQKIFERVYAAERTANEAPMLAMSKRLTTLKTDTTKIFGPDSNFARQMELFAEYINNFGLKVIGTEEEIQQFETSLAEFNETIMTQYGLVAAQANMPVTKLLGTSAKGLNATGEGDEANYHEEIESIQEEIGTPFIERHHLCLMRSEIAPKFGIAPLETEIVWNPLDSYTTKEQAEINKMKADTAAVYANTGALDGTDIRESIIGDPDSGYNGLDPIVPEGPGDREHEHEMEKKLLEQPAEKDTSAMDQVLAAGIMYTAGRKILLMKNRDGEYGEGWWAFPAGKIEAGETSLEAACREFCEETGKKIHSAAFLSMVDDFVLYQAYGDEFVPMLCDEHSAYVWADPTTLPSPLHPGVADQIRLGLGVAPVA